MTVNVQADQIALRKDFIPGAPTQIVVDANTLNGQAGAYYTNAANHAVDDAAVEGDSVEDALVVLTSTLATIAKDLWMGIA